MTLTRITWSNRPKNKGSKAGGHSSIGPAPAMLFVMGPQLTPGTTHRFDVQTLARIKLWKL